MAAFHGNKPNKQQVQETFDLLVKSIPQYGWSILSRNKDIIFFVSTTDRFCQFGLNLSSPTQTIHVKPMGRGAKHVTELIGLFFIDRIPDYIKIAELSR